MKVNFNQHSLTGGCGCDADVVPTYNAAWFFKDLGPETEGTTVLSLNNCCGRTITHYDCPLPLILCCA